MGVLENGVFYYGAMHRDRPAVVKSVQATALPYDADVDDMTNARRFFGFTDHEPIDVYTLRSRRATMVRQSPGMAHVVDYWYGMLERINRPSPVKTWRQMMDE